MWLVLDKLDEVGKLDGAKVDEKFDQRVSEEKLVDVDELAA